MKRVLFLSKISNFLFIWGFIIPKRDIHCTKICLHLFFYRGIKSFLILLLLFTFSFLLFTGCERNYNSITNQPVEPRITSHEFEWELDTLGGPHQWQFFPQNIWGTDEKNVWIVSYGPTNYELLHYWNGKKWENRTPFFNTSYVLYDIHGFSNQDLWIAGDDDYYDNINHVIKSQALVAHFNGTDWELFNQFNIPYACESIWGTSSNNIHVGCTGGIFMHFDGQQWDIQDTGTKARIITIFGFDSHNIFAGGIGGDKKPPQDTTKYFIFKYNEGTWEVLNEYYRWYKRQPMLNISTDFGHRTLWGKDGVLYSGGLGLYRYSGGDRWDPIFDKNTFISKIYGNGLNDIFALEVFKGIYHY
ncbi:hypothetical protein B1H10_00835, partial [candidate division KSB1 bacterium 4484_188]